MFLAFKIAFIIRDLVAKAEVFPAQVGQGLMLLLRLMLLLLMLLRLMRQPGQPIRRSPEGGEPVALLATVAPSTVISYYSLITVC